jgi:hypothetical protein
LLLVLTLRGQGSAVGQSGSDYDLAKVEWMIRDNKVSSFNTRLSVQPEALARQQCRAAVLDLLTGRAEPPGRLPFELPSWVTAVEAQDRPCLMTAGPALCPRRKPAA